ncbi:DMT family transporter [Bacillus salitolerans]|uniref:DMT family transporter n=1 Tax=Bacillus salitolerans TaxID=1437434 RepID=A0ABW4LRM1_9BACI
MDNKLALLLIGLGASLWGIIGLFVTYLYELGFTPTQVVAVRALCASICMIVYVLFKNISLLKIHLNDSKYFIGTGVFSIALFNWCLFSAIEETSISISFILLYTAPAFVTVLSRLLFKELFTTRKMLALFITFMGCSFVIGIFPVFEGSISLYGLILGLGSGFFYALYSIFGKFALKKYDSLTVTLYTFIFSAVAILPFSKLWEIPNLFLNIESWLLIIGLGFLSTMLPFIFYTRGLQLIESSRASIIATIEPVVAALVGFFIFNEHLSIWQYIGIFMVIMAVVIVQESKGKRNNIVVSTEIHQ